MRADFGSGMKQRRGLAFDDFQVIIQRYCPVAIEVALENFSLSQERAGVGGPLHNGFIELAGEFKSFDKQEISSDQSGLQAEFFVGGLLAPARLRAINNIVVQQSRRVDQLDGCGDVDNILSVLTAEGRVSQQRDHRTHSLPAAQYEVRRNVGEVLLSRSNRAREIFFDPFKSLADASEGIFAAMQQRYSSLPPGRDIGRHPMRLGFLDQG